jgi:hypothetical protein
MIAADAVTKIIKIINGIKLILIIRTPPIDIYYTIFFVFCQLSILNFVYFCYIFTRGDNDGI